MLSLLTHRDGMHKDVIEQIMKIAQKNRLCK
jgi:hypothetical protein